MTDAYDWSAVDLYDEAPCDECGALPDERCVCRCEQCASAWSTHSHYCPEYVSPLDRVGPEGWS